MTARWTHESIAKIAEYIRHVSQNKACQGLKHTDRDIRASSRRRESMSVRLYEPRGRDIELAASSWCKGDRRV